MKFEPPKIDPKKALGSLDGLANKIPQDVANLLKKIAIALFGFFLLIAIYYGWTMGYGDNSQEGLKLAEDTKSLFKEEMEREYNRKRKNIRISDIELNISQRAEERMIRDELKRSSNPQEEKRILDPNDRLLEDSADLSNQKKDSSFPSALTPKSDNLDSIPGKDESEDNRGKLLPSSDKLKRLESLEEEIQKSETATKRLEKTLDRLENLEKRELVKPR